MNLEMISYYTMLELNGSKHLPAGYNVGLLKTLNRKYGFEVSEDNQKKVNETIEIYFNLTYTIKP